MEKQKTKKIYGRSVPIITLEILEKKIKPFGKGSCHVTIPKRHEGRTAEVNVLSLYPFICKSCHETISREELFSPTKDLCQHCFNMDLAIKKNRCLLCHGQNPKKEFWGKCEKCFLKKEEVEAKNN